MKTFNVLKILWYKLIKMTEIKRIEKDNYYDLDLWITRDYNWFEVECDKYWKVVIEDRWFNNCDESNKYIIVDKEEYVNYTLNYFISEYEKEWLETGWFKKQKILLAQINDDYIIIDNSFTESDPNRLIIKDIEPSRYNDAIEYFCKLGFVARTLVLYWLIQKENENTSKFTKEENKKIRNNYEKAKNILKEEDYIFRKQIVIIVYSYFCILFSDYASKYNTGEINSILADELKDYWFSVTHHEEYLIYPNGERENITDTKYETLYNSFIDTSDYYCNKSYEINRLTINKDIEEIKKEYDELIQEIENQDNPINQYIDWIDSIVENLKEEFAEE